ncbi:hypothetical protein ACN4EG_12235 [Alkalinema pantanalense CENA528]|uniref:hypothetical protein n=1 Tax=Alkalinema pantanalense TaxID=1620705 RepID=UPI003D6E296E
MPLFQFAVLDAGIPPMRYWLSISASISASIVSWACAQQVLAGEVSVPQPSSVESLPVKPSQGAVNKSVNANSNPYPITYNQPASLNTVLDQQGKSSASLLELESESLENSHSIELSTDFLNPDPFVGQVISVDPVPLNVSNSWLASDTGLTNPTSPPVSPAQSADQIVSSKSVSTNNASINNASINNASINNASINNASTNNASINNASINNASINNASTNNASITEATRALGATQSRPSEVSPSAPTIASQPINSVETVPTLESTVQDGRVQLVPKTAPGAEAIVSPEEAQKNQVFNALSNSSQRYPALVNPYGRSQPRLNWWEQRKKSNAVSFSTSLVGQQLTVKDFSMTSFAPDQQLYWILPGNRIVMETQGWVGDFDYLGRATDTVIEQKFKVTQALWGMQAVWMLPQPLIDLIDQEGAENNSILSISGEVNNLDGANVSSIDLDANGFLSGQTVGQTANRNAPIIVRPPRPGEASTYNPEGGGSLFDSLLPVNTPRILQAFPSTNLQVLLEGDGLFEGAQIDAALLERAGISFGNPFTGEGFAFNPETTSLPGIKTLQRDQFDNYDLLNVLSNPFISDKQRQLYYLNSLYWVSLGLRKPRILDTAVTKNAEDWYLARLTRPHNRTLLQYEKQPGRATYYNLFINPGVAVAFSKDANEFHQAQSINTSLGYLLGGVFTFVHPYRLEKSLWEADLRRKREEPFAPLRTNTTSEQRKQINVRINQSLNIAQLSSGLHIVSGSFTYPSPITPTQSHLFQVRTGTHRRFVQLIQADQSVRSSEIYISKLRLSDQTFGPLATIGLPVPTKLTSIDKNRTTAVKTIVANDKQTVQFELSDDLNLVAVPIGIRLFDMTFDRIELSQIGYVTTELQSFEGYLQLPAMEAVWQKSHGKFYYAVAAGAWLNFSKNVAPNVVRNDIGTPEPGFGMYANAVVNWANPQVKLNADKKIVAVTNNIATLQLSWNSAQTRNNPAYANFSYVYLHQTPAVNYTLSAGVFLAANSRAEKGEKSVTLTNFLTSQFNFASGFNANASLELSDRGYLTLEAMQTISPRWAVGMYYQNYQTRTGLNRRLDGSQVGVILQRRSRKGSTWQLRIGRQREDWEFQLQGDFRF